MLLPAETTRVPSWLRILGCGPGSQDGRAGRQPPLSECMRVISLTGPKSWEEIFSSGPSYFRTLSQESAYTHRLNREDGFLYTH